jgi:sensor histidine kinase regulating citrate/malate metabolism
MDLGGLAILYAHYLQCREFRTVRQLEAVQNMMQKQYQQYQMSKESIELVNRKYHDLKHQIAVLRSEVGAARQNEFLDQMENEIKIYEAQNKTGNQVLDTLLTSKSLYCSQHGISLTCVADGSLLDFIEIMDLSAIFGNALDNAIECEEKITDPEKKLIHLSVSAQQGFVLIRCENYCEKAPDLSEGLPRTTKSDGNFHGYGLKSIRFFAQKYGGTVTVRMEKQWFVLQILLPQSLCG